MEEIKLKLDPEEYKRYLRFKELDELVRPITDDDTYLYIRDRDMQETIILYKGDEIAKTLAQTVKLLMESLDEKTRGYNELNYKWSKVAGLEINYNKLQREYEELSEREFDFRSEVRKWKLKDLRKFKRD